MLCFRKNYRKCIVFTKFIFQKNYSGSISDFKLFVKNKCLNYIVEHNRNFYTAFISIPII